MTPNQTIDELLENTYQRPPSRKPPTGSSMKPMMLSFKEWAGSQVTAYRLGLVLGYIAMMYFGATSYTAGIPTFTFTTPEGWTPFWAGAVVIGGLIAAVGSLKAGTEPITKQVRIYNRIELVGSIILFLALGTYAFILLYIGYTYHDPGRQSIGSGFVALGIQPAIRFLWLLIRPRLLAAKGHHTVATGPAMLIPEGFVLARVEDIEPTAKSKYEAELKAEND